MVEREAVYEECDVAGAALLVIEFLPADAQIGHALAPLDTERSIPLR
jgi:hypothetical protein